jgi:hypothetical protein
MRSNIERYTFVVQPLYGGKFTKTKIVVGSVAPTRIERLAQDCWLGNVNLRACAKNAASDIQLGRLSANSKREMAIIFVTFGLPDDGSDP